jgi:hypothetical protein
MEAALAGWYEISGPNQKLGRVAAVYFNQSDRKAAFFN